MNILFSTGHPAQVHNYRVIREQLQKKGHKVFWLASKKDISDYLLHAYGIEYTQLKRPNKGMFSKLTTLLENAWITAKVIRKNQIDFVVSRINPGVVLGAFLMGRKQIGMSDTEQAGIYDKLFSKLVGAVVTSTSFERTLRKDQIRFDANIELFYLHKNYFKYERKEVYKLLGITEGTPFVVARFVSGNAFHDTKIDSFSEENKVKLMERITPFAKLFISSEEELPEVLKPYQYKIPYEKMHGVLAEATLLFGESATMASESAIIGTPGIYVNGQWRGYTNDETRAGLVFSYRIDEKSQIASINKAVELLLLKDLKEDIKKKKETFLSSKIDPVAFMIWFIENYPESKRIMLENPKYQYRFK